MVEDDENLNRGITFSLKKSGYEVFSAESVKKSERKLQVIIMWMLPFVGSVKIYAQNCLRAPAE